MQFIYLSYNFDIFFVPNKLSIKLPIDSLKGYKNVDHCLSIRPLLVKIPEYAYIGE